MTPATLNADEIYTLARIGLDGRAIVKAMLRSRPYDEQTDAPMPWPQDCSISVKDLLEAAVLPPHWDDRPKETYMCAEGLASAETWRSACRTLVMRGEVDRIPQDGPSQAQIVEIEKATRRMLQEDLPDGLQTPAFFVLEHQPGECGFFQPLGNPNLTEIPGWLERFGANDCKNGLRHVVKNADFGAGLKLNVWRYRQAPFGEGERLHDILAVLHDTAGRAAGHLWARVVNLPEYFDAQSLVSLLDAYDADGLDLGIGLSNALEDEMLLEENLCDGKGILHLQRMEMRADLRGQKHGEKLLTMALRPALKGLRGGVNKIVMALKPMQYDYPVDEYLPAQATIQALDAVESLRGHVESFDWQAMIGSAKPPRVIHLRTDARATGSHLEQLEALSEH